MARDARKKFQYSIEFKNQEKLNVWNAYTQCDQNAKHYEPLVIIKKNNFKSLAVVDLDHFINMHKSDNDNEDT